MNSKSSNNYVQSVLTGLNSSEILERFRSSRESLAKDPYRPIFHFSPPENIINDPNGLCEWNGFYHLFYQFKPEGEQRVHWGHTVSTDLVHWQDLEPAIYPTLEKDCYSGQTIVEDNRVIAIYHGTELGNCIAVSSDSMLNKWDKLPDNPVIPIVPVDKNILPYKVFDPCIWKESDGYYSVSGVYMNGERSVDCIAVNHLFYSKNLNDWKHIGRLFTSSYFTEPGEDGAVPNFLPIGNGKHLFLFFSHKRCSQYFIGSYDKHTHRFEPEIHGRMNYGAYQNASLHAPSATVDKSGRVLAIFNVKEGKPAEGWQDVMTLPRQLSLDSDGSLNISPVSETKNLRLEEANIFNVKAEHGEDILLDNIGGKSIEIEAEIDLGSAREAGFYVLRSIDGMEKTRVSLLRSNKHPIVKDSIQIDVSESSNHLEVYGRPPETGPIDLIDDRILRLRIFIDRSIIEVFGNDKQCLTIRSYPLREDSRFISFFSRGGTSELLKMKVWQMKSIWAELQYRETQ